MNTKEILSYFALDPQVGLSLKEQLSEKIGVFISISPAGTVLPSERKLAETLGISRVTVRSALKKYFDCGQLVSRGRNGTAVADVPLALDRLDPGVFSIPVPPEEIQFLCYETLPSQQTYWQKTVQLYNRKNPEKRVRINFVDVQSCPAAFDYPGGDVLTFPYWNITQDRESYFQPLPEGFLHPQKDPAFVSSLLPDDPVFRYLVPVELQYRLLVWNRKLADSCGFGSLKKTIAELGFFGLIRCAHETLPEKFRIGGHVWDLMSFPCVPENGEISPVVRCLLEELAALPESERIFFTSQKHSLDMVENFWKGKQLFVDIYANFYAYLGKTNFPAEAVLFPAPQESKTMVSSMMVGISRQCRQPEAAADFIQFLLSDEVQAQLFPQKYTLPLRRKMLEDILADEYALSEEMREKYISSLRLAVGECASALQWFQFAVYEIRQEIIMVTQHKLSPAEAFDRICKKWQKKTVNVKNKAC